MSRKKWIKWFSILFLLVSLPYLFYVAIAPPQITDATRNNIGSNDKFIMGVDEDDIMEELLWKISLGKELPSYFLRWSLTRNVSHLFEDYAKWHRQQLSSIVQNGCVNASNELKATGDVVVFRPWESSGLANVMIGVVSSFVVSLLGGKVFLLNWQGHYYCNAGAHQLFQTPFIGDQTLEWSYPNFYANNHPLRLCIPNPKDRGDDKPLRNYVGLYELTHRYKESINGFKFVKCNNYFLDLKGWNEFRSNQYFINLIRENQNMRLLLEKMFPDGDVYGVVSRFLFKPLPQIAQKAFDFLIKNEIIIPDIFKADFTIDSNYKGKYKMIGLQIRRNENEKSIVWFKESEEKFFWDCAEDIAKNWKEEYRILIMSDNATTIANTQAHFPPGVTITFPQEHTFSRSLISVQNALVDILLLSYSHAHVVSKMSTFGNVGHGRASAIPWVVQRVGKIGDCKCYKAKTSEPDFHWQSRSKDYKCIPWMF
jgi:hypothetical protein